MDDDLMKKLSRRNLINEGEEGAVLPSTNVFNPFTEFKEFSRKEIQGFQKTFNKYDTGGDKFIDFMELKFMMEKLEAPQTHLSLKAMIKEVDEDHDDKINFREFLLIFRKAKAGELDPGSGLIDLYQFVTEIDVDVEGVKGAKNFFEAKIDQITVTSKFEQEIRDEQEEKRKQNEEAAVRKAEFKNKSNFFTSQMNG